MPFWWAALTASARGIANSKNWFSGMPFFGISSVSGLPLDQLHRDEVDTVSFFDRVDGDDVGMIECSDGFGFTLEPDPALFALGHLGRKNFQCDLPVELGVLGQIDLAHPS